MNPKLKTYLLLVGQLAIGIAILVSIEQIKVEATIKSIAIFILMLLLNLGYTALFGLKKELLAYWSLRKSYQLLPGVVSGFLLIIIPVAIALSVGKLGSRAIYMDSFSLTSVAVTFIITGWEELWFRSLLLNYSSRHLSKLNVSITMGILFTLVHMLNPEIKLRDEGLQLFLASTLLTALYYYYRSIWITVGLHFGNNYFGAHLHHNLQADLWFGSEGYIYVCLLLLATCLFLARLQKQTVRRTPVQVSL